jgi:hypothetical protein
MVPRALMIAVLALSAGTARAELVRPDSISPAPAGWVTDQYKRLGLVFVPVFNSWGDGTWAAGVYKQGDAWASFIAYYTRSPDGTPLGPPEPGIQHDSLTVRFVMPGTGAPAMTDSVRVHLQSNYDAVFTLKGYDIAGNLISARDVLVHGSFDDWLMLRASRIHSFEILSSWPPPAPSPNPAPVMNSPFISVEGIEFSPVPALPEPGGLVLSGLGALILTVARLRQGLPAPASRG